MFRAGLSRKHDQFLGAVTLIVDIGDECQTDAIKLSQAEIDDLDIFTLFGSNCNTCLLQHLHRLFLRLSISTTSKHDVYLYSGFDQGGCS